MAAAAAVLVIGVAAAEQRGWPFLRAPLASRAEAALGLPVRLDGGFRLKLLGAPLLEVGHLGVGAGGGLALPHLLDAQGLQLRWHWGDLWRAWRGGPLRVERLVAQAVDVRAVRDAQGRASWQLGRGGSGGERPPPAFGWLQVDRGQVLVDDAPTGTVLKLVIEGGERGEGGEAGARAGWRAQADGRWQRLPFALRAEAGAALPLVHDAGRAREVPLVPFTLEGTAGAARVRFQGRVGALLGARRLDGDIELAGPSLARVGAPLGLTLPQTPPFELAGHLNHGGGVWHLQAERAAIGRSRLQGDFRYDTRPAVPLLTGTLGGTLLALQDLGPAVGTAPPGQPRAGAAAARVLPDRRFDLPSLGFMNADVQVDIDRLDLGTTALAPIADLRTRVRLQNAVLRLDELHAVAAGGRVAGSASLDAQREPARFGLDLALEGIDIARALPAAQRGKGQAPYVTGTLGGHVRAAGRGRSTAEILATLDGSAQLQLADGTLSHLLTEAAGIDLAQALGVWVKGDEPLPLRCARADLAIEQGVARIRRAVLDNKDSTLRVAGQVDLRNEQLALQARVRPKDLSPLSLRTPVTISGTLAKPQVGVESKRLAGKLLGSVVLGALVGPLAALVPLVDTGEGREADPCAQKVER